MMPIIDPDASRTIVDPDAGSPVDFLQSKVPDPFSEIGSSLKESGKTIAEGVMGKGEQGVIGGSLKTLGAMAEIPLALPKAAGAGIGALFGPPMAGLEHAVGTLIAPKIAARDKPEEMYKRASEDVQTAAGGTRSGVMPRTVKIIQPPRTVEQEAYEKILKRFTSDVKSGGPSAQDAMDLVDEAARQGKPLTLADVAGSEVRGLAGNVARQPGPGRALATNFLNQRDQQAAARLSADIDKYISSGPTMHATTETLLKARSAANRKPWEDIRAMQGIWSPDLDAFFADPVIKQGLNRGYEIERLEALAEKRPITATQMGVDIDSEGNVSIVDKPNMRLLDMVRQGLDGMIADERNDITGRLSARGVALSKVRTSYVKTIDDLDKSGTYRKGRELWAGYNRSLDAVREGRTIFSRQPAEIADEISNLSASDAEFYRLGVADIVREKLAKTGFSGDEAKSLLKNSWMRDQLKPIFRSEKEFNAFVDSVMAEQQMFATRFRTLGGSQTAERLAEDTGGIPKPVEGALSAGAQLFTGHPIKSAITAWKTYRDLGLRPNPELNEKIAEILFRTPLGGP